MARRITRTIAAADLDTRMQVSLLVTCKYAYAVAGTLRAADIDFDLRSAIYDATRGVKSNNKVQLVMTPAQADLYNEAQDAYNTASKAAHDAAEYQVSAYDIQNRAGAAMAHLRKQVEPIACDSCGYDIEETDTGAQSAEVGSVVVNACGVTCADEFTTLVMQAEDGTLNREMRRGARPVEAIEFAGAPDPLDDKIEIIECSLDGSERTDRGARVLARYDVDVDGKTVAQIEKTRRPNCKTAIDWTTYYESGKKIVRGSLKLAKEDALKIAYGIARRFCNDCSVLLAAEEGVASGKCWICRAPDGELRGFCEACGVEVQVVADRPDCSNGKYDAETMFFGCDECIEAAAEDARDRRAPFVSASGSSLRGANAAKDAEVVASAGIAQRPRSDAQRTCLDCPAILRDGEGLVTGMCFECIIKEHDRRAAELDCVMKQSREMLAGSAERRESYARGIAYDALADERGENTRALLGAELYEVARRRSFYETCV